MWRCTVLSWRRDFSRPVEWTKDGRLVYSAQPELDPIIRLLKETLKHLINHRSVEGFTNQELYHVCAALHLREDELTFEQNKERSL